MLVVRPVVPVTAGFVVAGQPVIYTITASNRGPDTATSVNMSYSVNSSHMVSAAVSQGSDNEAALADCGWLKAPCPPLNR